MKKNTPLHIEEILAKYYDQTASTEEIKAIKEWKNLSEENCHIAKQIYTLLFASDVLNIASEIDTETALQKTNRRIARKHFWNTCHIWTQRTAAILFLPLIITTFILYQHTSSRQPTAEMIEIHTKQGMTSSFYLPDSTLVYLNSGSTFSYPSQFNGNERNVYLNGEAFFNVTKDPNRRFVITTPKESKVEVFGTSFNMEAFSHTNHIVTTLIEGSIGFIYKQSGCLHRIILKPGEKVTYDTEKENIQLCNTDGVSESSWKEGKIILSNTPFGEALQMLEKYYNVEFIVRNKKFKSYAFTGTFINQSLERVLEYFQTSSRIQWRFIEDVKGESTKTQIELY